MNRLKYFVFLLVLAAVSGLAHADIDVYEFESEQDRELYLDLTSKLRCPKCQNQDIADSNAPIAKDMRRQVHKMVSEGKTDQEIVDYMVERFGEFVNYKPKIKTETYLLWYGPWVLLLIGLFIVALLGHRKRRMASETEAKGSSFGSEDEIHRRVEALRKQYEADDKGGTGQSSSGEKD